MPLQRFDECALDLDRVLFVGDGQVLFDNGITVVTGCKLADVIDEAFHRSLTSSPGTAGEPPSPPRPATA